MTHQTFTRTARIPLARKVKAYIRLTRWREHVPYTIPLVVAGALMSAHINQISLGLHLVPVLVANILAMTFAFMINDIEDAPDDARDPHKKQHNVISMGYLSQAEGIVFAASVFLIAIVLYALGGWKTFGTGGMTLVLCYLYSASPFRLKARPVVDIVSHVLMLAGLLVLSGYLIYDAYPEEAWFMIIAIMLGSAYGQFYNQVDDIDVDKLAGLRNTAILLGKPLTKILMIGSIVLGVAFFLVAVVLNCFPLWLGPIALVVIFTLSLFRWNYDMRGNETDSSGMIQTPVLIAGNIIVLIWLLQTMGLLIIPS